MKIRLIIIAAVVLLALFLMGASVPKVYYQIDDPRGDDTGYGTYHYPTNVAFTPYKEIFDITEFKVWSEGGDQIYFDTTFGKVTNPWMAPEGFIHQNLRIFLDSVPLQGSSELPQRGANVRFNPQYAWDICLKIVGWGNSQLIIYQNGKNIYRPLKTQLLGDNRTIRATVPAGLLGKPSNNWNYYVLVGSYDGFGADFFRKVAQKPDEWVIGGGGNESIQPQVLDLVAVERGSCSQTKQLRSFNPENGRMAELFPVGRNLTQLNVMGWLGNIVILIIIGAIAFVLYQRFFKKARISWFWIKNSSKNAN